MKKLLSIFLAELLVFTSLLAALPHAYAQFADQRQYAPTTGGSANAQTVAIPNYALNIGVVVRFRASFTNTGAMTLGVNGGAAKALLKFGLSGLVALTGGEVVSGQISEAIYDGTQYQLISPQAAVKTTINANAPPYNVKCDGATDDSTGINAAIAAGGVLPTGADVVLPAGNCVANSTISILAPNVTLSGQGFNTTVIIGALALTPVISIGGSGSSFNYSNKLQHLAVSRAAGVPGAGVVGVAWSNFDYGTMDDVLLMNHGVGARFTGTVAHLQSAGMIATRIYTANIVTVDLDFADVSTITFRDSQFGRNGGELYNRQGFMQIRGISDGMWFDTDEFVSRDSGGPTPYLAEFNGYTPSTGGVTWFTNINVENITSCFISDATTTSITEFQLLGGRIDCANVFALNAATSLGFSRITGANIGGAFSLTDPTAGLTISGNVFLGGLTLVGGTGATAAVVGNTIAGGNVNLSGAWSNLTYAANPILGAGTFTDTSTGTKAVGATCSGAPSATVNGIATAC